MVVMEMKTPAGVAIKFNNAEYQNKTEAEKEVMREGVSKAVSTMLQRRLRK